MTAKSKNKVYNNAQSQFATVEAVAANLSIDEIDYSLHNYRKHFRQEDLDAFATELKEHGVISPLTVRKMDNGRFQLIAGERRLRAARIAGISQIPVLIKQLTDGQVIEFQLAENLQRENPHPMDEALAIHQMQQQSMSIEEIAARLGKSKQFVYIRLKLLNLIEPFQEMFLAEKIRMNDALEIASISKDGQTEFFSECCSNWQQKNFQLPNINWNLRKYKYDLHNAPFNIKDKKLIPEAGACSTCAFNSATLKSLFPEIAKQAI